MFYKSILRNLWIFGDMMKMSAAVITTFTSYERYVAISQLEKFKYINRPVVARRVIAFSLIVGTLHFFPLITGSVVPQVSSSNLYLFKPDILGSKIYDVTVQMIVGLKIGTSLIMALFSFLVVVGLVNKSKKAEMLTLTAKNKWKDCKLLCILQLITAATYILDHSVYVSCKLVQYNIMIVGLDAVKQLDFEIAIAALNNKLIYNATNVGQSLTGKIDHSCRFFIYMICVKSFRDTFYTLFKKYRGKVSPTSAVLTDAITTHVTSKI